jgi:hypothetical protein
MRVVRMRNHYPHWLELDVAVPVESVGSGGDSVAAVAPATDGARPAPVADFVRRARCTGTRESAPVRCPRSARAPVRWIAVGDAVWPEQCLATAHFVPRPLAAVAAAPARDAPDVVLIIGGVLLACVFLPIIRLFLANVLYVPAVIVGGFLAWIYYGIRSMVRRLFG